MFGIRISTLAAAILPIVGIAATAGASVAQPEKLTILAEIPRAGEFFAYGYGAVWLMSHNTLTRVNPSDLTIVDTVVDGATEIRRGLAVGEGGIWIPDVGAGKVFKIDPVTGHVASSFPAAMMGDEGTIGVGDGSVWIAAEGKGSTLGRFSAADGTRQAEIRLPGAGAGVVVAAGSVWVTSPFKKALYRIDTKTNLVLGTTAMGPVPRSVTAGAGSVWVLNQGDGSVTRVDEKTGSILATIDANARGQNGDLAFGGGYLWAAVNFHTIVQIDPSTNRVLHRFDREPVVQVRYGDDVLWGSGSSIFKMKVPD